MLTHILLRWRWERRHGLRCAQHRGRRVAAARQWGFLTIRAFRNRSHFLFGQPVNLGSWAFYRHGGRGPLSTDLVVMPPIKALSGRWWGFGLQPIPVVEINLTFSSLILIDQRLILNLKDLELSLIPFLDRSIYRAHYVIIVSYVLSNITTSIYLSILKQKLILIFRPLVSKNHWLCHKTYVDCGALNTLGGKSLVSRSVNSCLLKTYNLILDILLSQLKLNLNHDVFGMNTRLVVIGVKYCQSIPAVWLMWIFSAVFHS
jgi:hypothetical protein